MTPFLMSALYCIPIALASLMGGWLSRVCGVNHARMQVGVSFVAGVILGVGLLHLLPHGYHELQSIDRIVQWMLAGFILMFFIERFFHFHHHDTADEFTPVEQPPDHSHECDHSHPHDQTHFQAIHPLEFNSMTWVGTALGMTMHSLIDGVAMAAAVSVEFEHSHRITLAGFGVFLAVLLHKPFDSMTISMLMTTARCSRGLRVLINSLYAVIVPVGVAIFFLSAGVTTAMLGSILGLAAGVFLCIASSDLLPELQFHSHDRFKLSSVFLLGVALAWGITYFESAGHDHLEPKNTPTAEQTHNP